MRTFQNSIARYLKVDADMRPDHLLTMLLNLLDLTIQHYEDGDPEFREFPVDNARKLKARGQKHIRELSFGPTAVNRFLISVLQQFLFQTIKRPSKLFIFPNDNGIVGDRI